MNSIKNIFGESKRKSEFNYETRFYESVHRFRFYRWAKILIATTVVVVIAAGIVGIRFS